MVGGLGGGIPAIVTAETFPLPCLTLKLHDLMQKSHSDWPVTHLRHSVMSAMVGNGGQAESQTRNTL